MPHNMDLSQAFFFVVVGLNWWKQRPLSQTLTNYPCHSSSLLLCSLPSHFFLFFLSVVSWSPSRRVEIKLILFVRVAVPPWKSMFSDLPSSGFGLQLFNKQKFLFLVTFRRKTSWCWKFSKTANLSIFLFSEIDTRSQFCFTAQYGAVWVGYTCIMLYMY